ncbi:hypothetical protein [Microlunatus soli]|uniref:Uncharacterized protein n=1 Tax=Microlunatus soli TaxID=630515 RepID=A0A1H1WHE6_9ACTN|nr:hypothetical protein [Microlunatus soli]SDS96515.1 hypothetical protein SAMN04489812_3656 [Microlunatus soli]
MPLRTAVRNAARRRDPNSHPLDAAGIGHLQSLFEEPDDSEGFTLHVIEP